MGSKRVGLARIEALIENLKRELSLGASSSLVLEGPLKAATNGTDLALQQFDGTEVARVHDGAVVPTASGTSTSLSAGTGMGWRRRVITLG